jgi:hypothetical protein
MMEVFTADHCAVIFHPDKLPKSKARFLFNVEENTTVEKSHTFCHNSTTIITFQLLNPRRTGGRTQTPANPYHMMC